MSVGESGRRPVVVLVHGAFHGAWCWEALRSELAVRGWRSQAVDLPSALRAEPPPGTSPEALPGVCDDAAVIRAAIDAIDGPVVVLAHSYGGIPATQATAGAPNVAHLVYLAAHLLDAQESVLSYAGDVAPKGTSVNGAVRPEPDAVAALYTDLPGDRAARIAARLVPHSARCVTDRLTQAGWHSIPSSYIICDDDQALPPSQQAEMAKRATATYRLCAGHCPFLSAPGQLAALVAEITDP